MENISAAMVEMTKQGVNTANAGTALRGMLSELAKDGSTVSDVLKEQTGKSFSTLMEEGKSLGDVLNILGESVGNDSTAFANLFSNVRAKQGALAIFNSGAQEFNGTVDQMKNSIGATGEAYGKANPGKIEIFVFDAGTELLIPDAAEVAAEKIKRDYPEWLTAETSEAEVYE